MSYPQITNYSKALRLFILVVPLFIHACNTDEEAPVVIDDESIPLSPVHQYFIDIAFGNEFSSGYNNIRKWDSNMLLYLPETKYDYLNDELERILSEVNPLLTNIQVQQVANEEEANFIVYFGDKDTYVSDYEPSVANLVESNWGLFWIYWNNFSIDHGSMYVDVIRTLDLDCQKHLLREELTQSLGLMNDSYDYASSIFYQEWTCGTDYAEIDKMIIEILYDPKITAGMTKEAVISYLRSLEAS